MALWGQFGSSHFILVSQLAQLGLRFVVGLSVSVPPTFVGLISQIHGTRGYKRNA